MLRILCLCSLALPLLGALAPAAPARQTGGGGGGQGVDRERMWYAPTAEDWKKPVLITWQRTWEDAVEVSRATGKPILVCVNMDGEIASEHYAGVRYRMPEIAALYEPYVCVIASVYRHNPRDFDPQGRRIECPRFGTVTCGEHIAIEPGLFERFFEGTRVAPRHIGVELDGAETYDVYYAWDTASVFEAIRAGVRDRPAPPPVADRGERTPPELVASRDVADRVAVEEAYLSADRDGRRAIVESAVRQVEKAPWGVLRLALFDLDLELNRLARQALARATDEGAVDLVLEALRVPLPEAERQELVAALERLGASSSRARALASVHRGLTARSSAVDVDGWSSSLAGAEYPAPKDWETLQSRVEGQAAAARTRPDDAAARLELAEASLALAVDPETAQILAADRSTASVYASLMFEDARRAALEAEELGASGWRLDAALAVASYYLGDLETAYARAEEAVGALPAGEQSWNAMASLALFAEARRKALDEAIQRKEAWPQEWISDVHSAYSVLARHPLGADYHVAAHHDFLRAWGAPGRAVRVLDEGLARFPDSWALHHRLRDRILEERGVAGLEAAYEDLLAEEGASPNLAWYAGYASIVAAEFHRRAGDDPAARGAYGRALEHYARSGQANPESRDSADHYAALALAGRARIALQAGELEAALADLLASFERRPQAAGTLDGLNLSPADTSRTLRARLAEADRADLVARLDEALARLDPQLLLLPAYERNLPDAAPAAPDGQRGQDRPGRRQRGG